MGAGTQPGRVWRLLAVLVAAVVAATVAVLAVRHRSSAHSPSPTVRVGESRVGRILVDSKGRTLYIYTKDKGTKSVCFGVCAKVWPPALVRGTPIAGPGVLAAKLSVTRRPDATSQLVYAGHPLYRALGDSRAGQINGEGLFGVWYVLSPAGRTIVRRGVIGGGGY